MCHLLVKVLAPAYAVSIVVTAMLLRACNSSAELTLPDCTMHDLQFQDIQKPDSSAASSEPMRLQSPVVEDAPLGGGPLPGPPVDPVYRGVSQDAASPEAVSPHRVLHSFLKQSLSSCSGGTFIVTGAAYSGGAFWFLDLVGSCSILAVSTNLML